jgi:integrase/recombinase XerD
MAADLVPGAMYEPELPDVAVRGTPPAKTPDDLAHLLRSVGAGDRLLEATGTWLISGRRKSALTRDAYIRDLGWWVAWCRARAADPVTVRAMETDLYGAALSVAGLADSTVALRLAAASSWYTYLIRHEVAAANPFEGMERPSLAGRKSSTRGLSREQMAAVLAHARDHESPRTYALLWLLYATAARIGSILEARVEQLGYDSGYQVIDLVTKGGKHDRKKLPPAAYDAVRTYLGDRDTGLLFATRTGRALDEPYALKLIRRVADAAGVPHAAQLSPHSIRHTALTHALNRPGAALHHVQDFAGHADPRTTRRYDRDSNSLSRSPADALAADMAEEIHHLDRG